MRLFFSVSLLLLLAVATLVAWRAWTESSSDKRSVPIPESREDGSAEHTVAGLTLDDDAHGAARSAVAVEATTSEAQPDAELSSRSIRELRVAVRHDDGRIIDRSNERDAAIIARCAVVISTKQPVTGKPPTDVRVGGNLSVLGDPDASGRRLFPLLRTLDSVPTYACLVFDTIAVDFATLRVEEVDLVLRATVLNAMFGDVVVSVNDAETREPIIGAIVFSVQTDRTVHATDGGGRAQFDLLPAGEFRLVVSDDNHVRTTTLVTVKAGTTTPAQPIYLERGVRIAGRAFRDGKPVDTFVVSSRRLFDESAKPEERTVWTDGGSFVLDPCKAGIYELRCRLPDELSDAEADKLRPVVVVDASAGSVSGLVITVP